MPYLIDVHRAPMPYLINVYSYPQSTYALPDWGPLVYHGGMCRKGKGLRGRDVGDKTVG